MKASIVVLVLLVGRLAHAGGNHGEAPPPPEEKSFWTAYLLTAGVMAATGALGAVAEESNHRGFQNVTGVIGIAAVVLGPSAGHFYVGRTFTTGLSLRLASAGVFGGLIALDPDLDHPETVAGIFGALGLYAAGMAHDFITLPGAVRRYNREHRLHLAPLVTPSGDATGLALGGTF